MFRRAMDPRRPRRMARWGDAAEYAKLFRIMKIQLVCLSSFAALCAGAKCIEAHVETRAPVQVKAEAVAGKAPSLLPPGKKWTLVWHDEFDRKEIDRTKWMCRESFWGYDFPAFAYGPYQRALLANAITHVPAETVGATRACHLFAAYWRAKRLGLWTEGAR